MRRAGCLGPLGGAHAADRVVALTKPTTLAPDIAALPRIVHPVDGAERKINATLDAWDGAARKEAADCRRAAGAEADWSRNVEIAMRGPRFLSLTIAKNFNCGGAHPNIEQSALAFDLRDGELIDWRRLGPPALVGEQTTSTGEGWTRERRLKSKRLYELFLAAYARVRPGDAECAQAVREAASDGLPDMAVWPDAEGRGLGLQFDLIHAEEACADPAVLPLETLRAVGMSDELLDAIAAAPKP